MRATGPPEMDQLQPTPYHRQVVDYLRREEAQLWDWFASVRARTDYAEKLRLDLLKQCYRLHSDSHPELAQAGREASERLGLEIPVTFYQAQQSSHLNASLFFLPGEGHIVFSGPVLSLLNSLELQAVIGHELAHYFLWQEDEGAFLIADRLIQAMGQHPEATPSHAQTARRFRLQTEIFADRGAFRVVSNLGGVVSSLVKMDTGLPQASGDNYLRQADEIFARGEVWSEQVSHPESFIRARALRLWSEKAAGLDEEVVRMIHGQEKLEQLDLLEQQQLTGLTLRLLTQLLRPSWFQSSAVLAHAQMFFPGFRVSTEEDPALVDEFAALSEPLRGYFAWVLLDFCVIDPDLDQTPTAAALEWSRRLHLEEAFTTLLKRELQMTARAVKQLQDRAKESLPLAEAGS